MKYNKVYAQHHAQMLPLSASRYKTGYRNTLQWNFLGCAFKKDPCQRRGTARMTGLVSERRNMGVIKERNVNTGNLQCFRITVPTIRLVSSKILVLTQRIFHRQTFHQPPQNLSRSTILWPPTSGIHQNPLKNISGNL